jgi:hypothetical protein
LYFASFRDYLEDAEQDYDEVGGDQENVRVKL